MRFEDISYKRPDIDGFEKKVSKLLGEFKNSKTFHEQKEIIDQINSLRNKVLTMAMVGEIRGLINLKSDVYNEESKYINKKWPIYDLVGGNFYKELINSKFNKDIIDTYGEQLMNIAKSSINTIREDVLEDLELENKLQRDYTKTIGLAKIKYKGELKTLAQLKYFCSSEDRVIRKEANEKKYELLEAISLELDKILDSLIEVRSRIAKKLGYKSFVELAYARLNRSGYTYKDIENFRNLTIKYIVPICNDLKTSMQERLQIDSLKYYDDEIDSIKYEQKDIKNTEWIKERFKIVCESISLETKELFEVIIQNNLMDLEAKEGKAKISMTTYLCDFKYPYIIASLTGIKKDFKTIAHEFGHAFQMYVFNEKNEVPEYILPTKEAAEFSSIAMEFLIWPYINEVIDEAEVYKFNHLEEVIKWIPYRACVDEFQEYIYSKQKLTIKERKLKWIQLEKKYMPNLNYDGNKYLLQGNFWQQQSHIFTLPFYYIDYALAQICALQLWSICEEDNKRAWKVYSEVCKKGGSLSFLNLIKGTGISSPFEEDTFIDITKAINKWICDYKILEKAFRIKV
ncbi:oligoendopeptidase, M3 family [Clostridium collagenovorans DSM 3089]|uniref:Oligoendopeptidase, M3 family n=1 Tax=Clostridium collagenovorans DSM 3089 TaxID=1121306 RepID=A0A1M5VBU1_9CLOT|nr:M3 family oligoendopeptidase [Clostridium collagenovorans]SHH72710.1 oligoendopeptidase, M3 family [Clostridium collagenovorans DSM 3089]